MKRSVNLKLAVLVLISFYSSIAYGQLFQEAVNYSSGQYPQALFSSDFDGDGDNDMAVANAGSNTVSIFMNNSDGIFALHSNYNTGIYPNSVFAIDLDGDVDVDLAVTNRDSHNVYIFKNNGDGTFQDALIFSVGNHPKKVKADDLDGDGDADLTVANRYSNDVSVLLNNGDGTFANAASYPAGSNPHSVFITDLDNDGDNDLAVTNLYSYDVSILLNNGNGTFQAGMTCDVGHHPHDITSKDFDNDGDNDLAVINNVDHNVSILFNNGDATFQDTINYAVGLKPLGIFSADFNGDANEDLVIANSWANNISILINNGDGTFQDQINYAVGAYPFTVFSTDFDGDNDNDIAVANPQSDNFSILINLNINYGYVCPSVYLENGLRVQGISMTLLDEFNNPVVDPIISDVNGEGIFDSVETGYYSVMIVTPLGYIVSPAETQTGIQVVTSNCSSVNFMLTPIIISNDGRSIGYWKHQFNVYTSGRGSAQETYAGLETYLGLVHQHFDVLGIYLDLENHNFDDAKNILTVRGGSLMADRAKQQLFALLLNLASEKIGQETPVSVDNRVAAEAVTWVANLIDDVDPNNDELAKDICDLINNGQFVGVGIIPESNIRYKLSSDGILSRGFLVSQNHPNPFNAQTTIEYELPQTSNVVIEIFDLLGRKIESIYQGSQSAGKYQITWDAVGVSSGVYFYSITAGDFTQKKKALLIK